MISVIATIAVFASSAAFPKQIQYLQNDEVRANAIVAATNIASGCLIGGVGAAINDGAFLTGCKNGAIGGAVYFSGVKILTFAELKYGTGAIGKFTASLGASMIHNAARDAGLLQSYSVSVGPVEFIFDKTEGFSANLSLISIGGMAYLAYTGKPDYIRSLVNMTPTFRMTPGTNYWNQNAIGVSIGGSIGYMQLGNRLAFSSLISHEMVHIAQWEMMSGARYLLTIGHLNIGRDLLFEASVLPFYKEAAYFWSPWEMEAYAMETKY